MLQWTLSGLRALYLWAPLVCFLCGQTLWSTVHVKNGLVRPAVRKGPPEHNASQSPIKLLPHLGKMQREEQYNPAGLCAYKRVEKVETPLCGSNGTWRHLPRILTGCFPAHITHVNIPVVCIFQAGITSRDDNWEQGWAAGEEGGSVFCGEHSWVIQMSLTASGHLWRAATGLQRDANQSKVCRQIVPELSFNRILQLCSKKYTYKRITESVNLDVNFKLSKSINYDLRMLLASLRLTASQREAEKESFHDFDFCRFIQPHYSDLWLQQNNHRNFI